MPMDVQKSRRWNMRIEKKKLPKNSSFVLRSSILEEAVLRAGIATEIDLYQGSSRTFFEASFLPPTPNVPHERFFVHTGSVPASQARAARDYMETNVIPGFITWATGILQLPANSIVRRNDQQFTCELRSKFITGQKGIG
jgi:hypothetical protein